MCEDISIVDDFDVRPGAVRGGVSLLIRPAEAKPASPDIFQAHPSIKAVEGCRLELHHTCRELLGPQFV
jgi:hypothetical protein